MNILQNKKLIAIIVSAVALVLILTLVLSLTMCNRAEPVDASIASEELSSEAVSVEESSEPSEEQPAISSEDETPSKTPSAAPSKPAESSAPAGRTQEEIDRLTEETLKSGNVLGSLRILIKTEYWEKKKLWTKEDFPGIPVKDIDDWSSFASRPVVPIWINCNSEDELKSIISKLYHFDFVDSVERSTTMTLD
jgi:Predicted membrane protein